MVAIIAFLILLATTPNPSPTQVTVNDLAGIWITVSGDCSPSGQHLLSGNGDYMTWCFGISKGTWLLRDGNKIVVTHDPKKSDEEIITVLSFKPHSDRAFLDVRYQDGHQEKWMKPIGNVQVLP